MKISLLDLLFPRQCLGCRRYGKYLCSNCVAKVPLARGMCIECQKPSIDGLTHAKCKTSLSLDRAMSLWRHTGVIRKAILQLKYKFSDDTILELSKHVSAKLKESAVGLPKEAYVVPVPLHISRSRWRGFNQSAEVGKHLARYFHWKYSDKLVLRVKNTSPQSLLSKKARKANIRDSFLVPGKLHLNTPIIIVDDVWTTGSTLKEMGKVLKKSGAKSVWSITIAK